jgi:5S rRNA maturation endonuclease (ribonuclease M5)
MKAADFAARVTGAKLRGGEWLVICPAHDDEKASLSFRDGEKGLLLKCFAGCTTDAICQALGLRLHDLFSNTPSATNDQKIRRIVAIYDYTDEKNALLFQVIRYEPKDFSQRRPDGCGGWVWNLKGTRIVLYRLSEIVKAEIVLIVEGERDVETAYQLGLPSGWAATTAPMGAGKWRLQYVDMLTGKHVVILPDADEPGRKHGEQVAQSLRGKAKRIDKITLPDGRKDLSEWAPSKTATDFLALLGQALQNGGESQIKSPTDTLSADREVARLASLPKLEYGRARKKAAQRWGVPMTYVDQEVRAKQKQKEHETAEVGPVLDTIVASKYPVDGGVLANKLAAIVRRFVVLNDNAIHAIVLWVLWSYAFNLWPICPYLAILSPVKQCGKTSLLILLSKLLDRVLLSSNISPAAIFRVIEAVQPTLLIDELDTFNEGDEALRGILNSGHTKDGAKVIRVHGERLEVRVFSTWCPKALAAIGSLPDTVTDRSIVIPMKRRAPREHIDRLRWSGATGAALAKEMRTLAGECKRWVEDHTDDLVKTNPTVPDAMPDRASDNWFCLLCVASVLGPDWLAKGEGAALALTGSDIGKSDSIKIQLLRDIQRIIHRLTKDTAIWSQDLCDQLALMEERPWSEWKHGKAMTPTQLAHLLKPFGIFSLDLKRGGAVKKGYEFAALADAFQRYICSSIPENPVSTCDPATSQSGSGNSSLFQSATSSEGSGANNARIPVLEAVSSVVAAQPQEIMSVEVEI